MTLYQVLERLRLTGLYLSQIDCAQGLYNGIQENNCSEQASRMSAMENSTKNASEILEKLTLSYNRQAAFHSALQFSSCSFHVW